ncbi:hypothetical protein AB1E18_014860 [Capra hircus]
MPSRTARYARYSPRQRRRRLLADRSVHFPNDVLFLDHIRQGDLEQVGRFIRTRKVSLDTIYPSGLAALHEAVLSGNLECVKLLVKYGADIHQRDETGWTPLHIACSDGYPDIARYLISLGADREAANDDGDLPSDLIDPEFKDLELQEPQTPASRPQPSVSAPPRAGGHVTCASARARRRRITSGRAPGSGGGGREGERPRGSGSGVRGPDTPAMTSSPVSRVVYNGKRNSSPRSPPNSSEIFTPAHEENVRFIYEAWQGVERDLRSQMSGSERGLVEEYVEKVPNPSLKTFKPIDLSDLKRRNTQDAKKS